MKAILVIDMPRNCYECRIFQDGLLYSYCPVGYLMPTDQYNKREDGCPLRPMPNKAAEDLVKGLDAMEKMQSVEVRKIIRTE